jgi:hypothetical protein
MSKEKFLNSDYKPDENTKQEIEDLHKDGKSLSDIQLKFADMKNAKLVNADLSHADLTRADFSGASLYGVNLEGANLFKANFEGTNLKAANMKNCNLLGVDLTAAKLNNVDWGDEHKVINEVEAEQAIADGDHQTANDKYKEAEDVYRNLKINLQAQTLGEDVGQVFLREMITKRKQLPMFSPLRIASKIAYLTTGYGEKIGNILYTVIGSIVSCAFLYGIEGVSYGEKLLKFEGTQSFAEMLNIFGDLFYFSVVVFSTVGFGEILPIGPLGKTLMIFEGLIGGLILAILIIAIYKQLMDR